MRPLMTLATGLFLASATLGAAQGLVVVAPGSGSRQGVTACPAHAVVVGADPATGRILCETEYRGPGDAVWLVNEALDGPGAARFNAFPRDAAEAARHGYAGGQMHWCGAGELMTGFDVASNLMLCAGVDTGLRRRFVTAPVRRSAGIPACPRGSAMAGIHIGDNLLLCVEPARCSQDAHCRVGTRCETVSIAASEGAGRLQAPGVCRPHGQLWFRDRNGCHGDGVGWMTDRSGNDVDFTRNDEYENDAAQSVRLQSVSAGTILRVFDRSDAGTNDDFTVILVRQTTLPDTCIETFELANDARDDAAFLGRYGGRRDNLDEKVSRVQVQTAIMTPTGKCLDVNQNTNGVQIFPCHAEANQAWVQDVNGAIRGVNGLCLEADPSAVGNWTPAGARSAPVRVGPCTGADTQVWSRTTSREIRLFSDMCLDVAGGGDADRTPVQVFPCHGGANQRWLASF